jgi:hypothetical protein
MGATASTKSQLLRLRQRATLLHALQAQNMPLDAYVYLPSTTCLPPSVSCFVSVSILRPPVPEDEGRDVTFWFVWMRMCASLL